MSRQQINNLKNIKVPERCLALAVIARAKVDADGNGTRGIAACRWLQSHDAYLLFWCEAAQIPVSKLHKRMMEVN